MWVGVTLVHSGYQRSDPFALDTNRELGDGGYY